MFRKFSLILVTLLLVVPLGVSALGLGEIKLKSGLNQPLRAEIALFSPEGMSEFEVSASLASLNEFEKAGIDYFGYLKNIRFKTVKGPGDSLYVEVSTREPIKEPFLNFLVELNWPKGRMLREYTLLLDPPIFSESRSTTVQTPKATVSAPQTTSQRPSQSRPQTRSTPTRQPTITGTTYGPVGEAETLWRIATGVKPANASIHQTLVALYRANPDAFVNGNIHLLKKGSTLVIPDAQAITSTPKRAALQDMVARLRGDRETILDTTGRSSSNQQATRGEDRLRLATPGQGTGADRSGSGGGNNADVRRLKDELAESKEAAATLEAENEELRRKLQDALGDLEDQKKGKVSVDSEVGAAIANQDSLSDPDDQITDQTNTTDDSLTNDSDDMTSDTSAGMTDTDSVVTNADDSNTATGEAQETRRLSDSAGGTSSANDNSVSTTGGLQSPQEESSWMDEPLYLYGALGLVGILVIAFVVFWRMRQRMSGDEFQDDLVVSAQGSSFDADDAFDMPDSGDDLLDDMGDDDVFGEESTTEADPLGEADIYIAYGKYDQAETLLTQAISEQPERKDLKLKLLECFAENKDRTKFDTAEQEYSDSFFGDSDATAQLQEIKSNAWPEDAGEEDDFELPSTEEIFGEDSSSEAADSIDDFSLDDLDDSGDMSLDDDFTSDDVSGEESDFDTDDMDFDIEEPASQGSSDSELDDFSLDDDSLEDNSLDTSALDDTSLDNNSFDSGTDEFSLDDDLLDMSDSDDAGLSAGDDLDLDLDDTSSSEISLDDDLDMNLDDDFDLGEDDDLDGDMMDGTDEASTKLDLARAYIDMGDIDGAKEILNEVIEEGGESHKSEALALLEKI
ncbi:MAG: FimV family protein [Gammaproteobacteria bacterium]|nr:FimV family protein [Gammaproteobacteria bacterium]